ncbi:MAG: UpxY family transcription antiterminator [Chlorobiaceae bacterium]|nr:UpxY family transcription antiterminator [Chlorobiaceae bacterium]
MEETCNPHWYAVYVRSRYEKKVYLQLLERGIESFLPLLETVRKWSDRTKKVAEPLFRGYVFVQIDYRHDHVKVLEVDGVVKYIGIGRKPSVIADRDIEWLRRLVREPEAIARTVGSIPLGKKVRVLAGPFKDFEGTALKEGRDHRLVVFFDSIMQGVEITIRPELLVVSGKEDVAPQPVEVAPSDVDIRHLARP